MKRFSFSLEAVLALRAREEQEAAQSWARALQDQARAEAALSAAKRALEDYHQLVEGLRKGRFQPAEQQVYLGAISSQKALSEQLAEALRKAVQVAATRRADYLRARTKHEMLVRLKEKKRSEYEREAMAREEAGLQDLIISRHGHRSDPL